MKQGFAHASDVDGQEAQVKTTSAPPASSTLVSKKTILRPLKGVI